ncbi:hypothetical protein HNQ60_000959 [Povalibacter uvarum]|uniref:Uncharacterized protein n=1 Tax=Povalibacter uvarum TaxID=732238 RepID=A0A841HHG0_9GAMM|nr:hypothetical protein [Povalibacter uvarum]MBB6092113.1 hypothetical protein [Povalibacter uvarum]
MSNPHASLFVASALGSLILTQNVFASASASEGQLIDGRGEAIELRVAIEPLVVNEPDIVAAADGIVATFDAPALVALSRNGETRNLEITSENLRFTFRDQGKFMVSRSAAGLIIQAPANSSGCPIYDQITGIWQAPGIRAYKRINVSQSSRTPPASGQDCSSRSSASVAPESGEDPLSGTSTDFDAAIRSRIADGSNAVRVVPPSVDGAGLLRIVEACERQRVWCLLDPGLAPADETGASASDPVKYFTQTAVHDTLLKHQDYVMLVVRESEGEALDPGDALNQLRGIGLPHVVLFSASSMRSGADAEALLGVDPYQAVALTVTAGHDPVMAASVPVVTLPDVQTAAADVPCKLKINHGSTTVLDVDCRVDAAGAGGMPELTIGGNHGAVRTTTRSDWFRAGASNTTSLPVIIDGWQSPTPGGSRIGILAVEVPGQQHSRVLGSVLVKQSSRYWRYNVDMFSGGVSALENLLDNRGASEWELANVSASGVYIFKQRADQSLIWRYNVDAFSGNIGALENLLDNRGASGWELANVSASGVYIFKQRADQNLGWRYNADAFSGDVGALENLLDNRGASGWELANVSASGTYIFKRRTNQNLTWRYNVDSFSGDVGALDNLLDNRGSAGWELANVSASGVYTFKQRTNRNLRWRYYVRSFSGGLGSLENMLDNRGRDGWELANVSASGVYIFKRPK